MRYLTLGKTGLEISEVGFGAIPIIRLSMNEAVQVLRRAYDRGVTFYDTAHLYLDSEEKIGRAFAGLRHRIVLASKTIKRDGSGALDELELSLRHLQTDYLDLYQFHQLSQETDYQSLIAPGGALEAVRRAQEAGRVDTLGLLPIISRWPSNSSRPASSAPSSSRSISSKWRPGKSFTPRPGNWVWAFWP
jgi:aryl-alcohol dehydrogenase-like predicted oxidoreductase